jgi:hypothetical protein
MKASMAGLTMLACVCSAPSSFAVNGNDILRNCKPLLDGFNSDSADVKETMDAAHCAGMVTGFNDMAVLVGQIVKREVYCVPKEGLEAGQVIRVYMKWLEDHPAELHDTARILFLQAMRESFPCSE